MDSGFYIYDTRNDEWYGGDGKWYVSTWQAFNFGSPEEADVSRKTLKRRFARVIQVNVIRVE